MAEADSIALRAIYGIILKSVLNIKSFNEHGPAKRGRYFVRLLTASYNSLIDEPSILLTLCQKRR
jgi:hypothetical protein